MNKKLLSSLLLILLVTIGYFSCKKADPVPAPLPSEEEYFPLVKGKYVIYDVDSTIWDVHHCVTVKRHYQFMYLVSDTFTDELGRMSYRIDTRIRRKPEEEWKTHEVYYATNTGTTLEMVHSELKFVKMQFPIQTNETWKGNAYINVADADLTYFKDWDYYYEAIREPYNSGNVIFDNTVTVIQRDEAVSDPETIPHQPAMRTYGKEIFASGIGMVYREYYHWEYDPSLKQNQDPINPEPCRKGAGVVMRAVDHN